MSATLTHPRFPARRGGVRARTWWGKAWVRTIEEAAYAEAERATGRSLARAGQVGAIAIEPGRFVGVVQTPDAQYAAVGTLPVLEDAQAADLVGLVAAESGRIARLLTGDLPIVLAEEAEEAGIELVPYAGELGWSCPCEAWIDPCPHALAVAYQVGWLLDADPLVLTHLRGLPRDDLVARLHRRAEPPDRAGSGADPLDPLEIALDAALRAARVLELLEQDRPFDHLL